MTIDKEFVGNRRWVQVLDDWQYGVRDKSDGWTFYVEGRSDQESYELANLITDLFNELGDRKNPFPDPLPPASPYDWPLDGYNLRFS